MVKRGVVFVFLLIFIGPGFYEHKHKNDGLFKVVFFRLIEPTVVISLHLYIFIC